MADLQGSYDELFAAAPTVLAKLLDDGDAGGSVAIFVDGQPVVDVWGGFADRQRSNPWQRDTITNVYSVTKTMTALCALILADRGQLDLDAPVGRYWPEFDAAGKGKVLVRHLLSHTAGLPDWTGPGRVDFPDREPAPARVGHDHLQGRAELVEGGSDVAAAGVFRQRRVGEVEDVDVDVGPRAAFRPATRPVR